MLNLELMNENKMQIPIQNVDTNILHHENDYFEKINRQSFWGHS